MKSSRRTTWATLRRLTVIAKDFGRASMYFHNRFVYEPDSFVAEDQFVEGDKVATRITAQVKVRETGEPITLVAINVAQIVGGKIVEEWNTGEQLQTSRG